MESRPPAAAAAAAAAAPQQLTPEEEALKRNTDCVYFLASPLTCKKGSECEYRHSETARVNPRDCYYWLNSNCTNPKCSFRHPPLEGIFSVLPPPVALPPATGYNPTKQSTPCYYFQKGNCVKGDRCLFMHGPLSSGATSIPQQPAKTSASPIAPSLGNHRKEPSNPSAIAKPAQQPSYNINNTKATQENPVPNATKPVNFNEPNAAALATTKPRAASTANNERQRPTKTSLAVGSFDEDRLKYPHPLSRGTQVQNRDMSDERPQDSREGDEFLGESSPGFDVIVDHDEEDSGYLPPNEEEFRRAYADSYNPAEMYPIEDYESLSRYERERHGVMSEHEYEPEYDLEADRFGYKGNDQYDRKRRRRDSSSDRALDRPIRRHSHREEAGIGAETGINGADLRLRLMNKQRKVNGSRSRSDVSPEKREDGHHRHHHRREEKHLDEWDRDSSRGMDRADQHVRGGVHGRSRLQGRIKMPPKSAERSDFMFEDMDMERRRHLRGGTRASPVPVDLSSRRLHDRMGQRLNGHEFAGRLSSRRDEAGFSGPKSLAELKGVKPTQKVSEGVVKESAVDFEGPKPLSEILKKKKKVAGMESGNVSLENKIHNDGSSPKDNPLDEEVEEGMISEGNGTDHEVQVTAKGDGADEKAFEEDQEMEEPYDETRGEDSNYYEGEDGGDDQIEDENAYREEGEEMNDYPEGEEDFEDDDEQDFARKVGVVLS